MKESFLSFVKEIDMQVQEAERVPNKMDAKRPTPRHIIIKMPKVKDIQSHEKQGPTAKTILPSKAII